MKQPPSPTLGRPGPNRIPDSQAFPKATPAPKFEPNYKQDMDFSYEGLGIPYQYMYQSGMHEPLPADYSATDRQYNYGGYTRNPRYYSGREQGRYKQAPPPKGYNSMAVPVERYSPDRFAAHHPPSYYYYDEGYEEVDYVPPMPAEQQHRSYPQQPIGYAPYPQGYRYDQAHVQTAMGHPPLPVQMNHPVPVIQRFSPPRMIPYPYSELIAEDNDEREYEPATLKNAPGQAQEIHLNLMNAKNREPITLPRYAVEASKTVSPDRKPYTIFEEAIDTSVYERYNGFFTPHSGMLTTKDAGVFTARNSPQRIEYKKYYSPTQKSRSNFSSTLFEMTKAMNPVATSDTLDKANRRQTMHN